MPLFESCTVMDEVSGFVRVHVEWSDMRLSRWIVIAALAGCSSKSDNLPVGTGGGGGGGGGGALPDAPSYDSRGPGDSPSAIDAPLINGRVCLAADPRMLTTCASTGADGLTVRLGSRAATTSADGHFTIDATDAGSSAVWRVTGASIVTSIMPFSDYQIPALATTTYDTLKANNLVSLLPGQGAIMVQLVRNGAGLAGQTAISMPSSTYEAFYDGSSPTGTWPQTSTGSNAVAWLAGLDVGTATVTAGTPALTTPQLPVVDGAITFWTIVFL